MTAKRYWSPELSALQKLPEEPALRGYCHSTSWQNHEALALYEPFLG